MDYKCMIRMRRRFVATVLLGFFADLSAEDNRGVRPEIQVGHAEPVQAAAFSPGWAACAHRQRQRDHSLIWKLERNGTMWSAREAPRLGRVLSVDGRVCRQRWRKTSFPW
jgi:hypothetical protein